MSARRAYLDTLAASATRRITQGLASAVEKEVEHSGQSDGIPATVGDVQVDNKEERVEDSVGDCLVYREPATSVISDPSGDLRQENNVSDPEFLDFEDIDSVVLETDGSGGSAVVESVEEKSKPTETGYFSDPTYETIEPDLPTTLSTIHPEPDDSVQSSFGRVEPEKTVCSDSTSGGDPSDVIEDVSSTAACSDSREQDSPATGQLSPFVEIAPESTSPHVRYSNTMEANEASSYLAETRRTILNLKSEFAPFPELKIGFVSLYHLLCFTASVLVILSFIFKVFYTGKKLISWCRRARARPSTSTEEDGDGFVEVNLNAPDKKTAERE